MGQRLVVIAVLAAVAGIVTGPALAVSITSHPQRVTQSQHDVTAGAAYSIDGRTTVYAGAAVDGYDVTVRNDGSVELTVNVTVRLLTHDGTVVASASESVTVLTGATATASVRFTDPVATSAYDRVYVETAKA